MFGLLEAQTGERHAREREHDVAVREGSHGAGLDAQGRRPCARPSPRGAKAAAPRDRPRRRWTLRRAAPTPREDRLTGRTLAPPRRGPLAATPRRRARESIALGPRRRRVRGAAEPLLERTDSTPQRGGESSSGPGDGRALERGRGGRPRQVFACAARGFRLIVDATAAGRPSRRASPPASGTWHTRPSSPRGRAAIPKRGRRRPSPPERRARRSTGRRDRASRPRPPRMLAGRRGVAHSRAASRACATMARAASQVSPGALPLGIRKACARASSADAGSDGSGSAAGSTGGGATGSTAAQEAAAGAGGGAGGATTGRRADCSPMATTPPSARTTPATHAPRRDIGDKG